MRARTFMMGLGGTVVALGLSGIFFASPVGGDPLGSNSPPVPNPTQCSVATTIALALSGTPQTATLTESCPFAPGSSVNLSYGGSAIQTVIAPADGLVTITVTGIDPHMSIDQLPYLPAAWGNNTVVGTGVNPSGGSNTATFLIDFTIPATLAATAPTGNGATPGSIGLAFTGANLIALIAAALALLLLGTAIVIYTRRKAVERRIIRQESYWTTTSGATPPAWQLTDIW